MSEEKKDKMPLKEAATVLNMQRLKGDNNVEKGATIPNLQPVSQGTSRQNTGSQPENSNQTSGESSSSSSESTE